MPSYQDSRNTIGGRGRRRHGWSPSADSNPLRREAAKEQQKSSDAFAGMPETRYGAKSHQSVD